MTPMGPVRRLYADPSGIFLHDLVLSSCRRFGERIAIVDISCAPPLRLTYAEYGDLIERLARGLVAQGVVSGDVIGIYLPNSWEFCVTYHAATLAGGVPTPLNPSYREREVRYQLEVSGAKILITDGPLIQGMDLSGLSQLQRVYSTRELAGASSVPIRELLQSRHIAVPKPHEPAQVTLASLPFSSGTTGLPKGVMLSHYNLVANIFQILSPTDEGSFQAHDTVLCCLPLYHIYGLNVVFNPGLVIGATIVLTPRFDLQRTMQLIVEEQLTIIPLVPPVMNALCQAAEAGFFPREHQLRYVNSGAAPLPVGLPRRFIQLTGVPVRNGYGMTEASPVTHMGFLEKELYRPESIGYPLAETECRILDESCQEVAPGEPGELVMHGPQFMMGYWKAPEATAAALRDGWYFSGDIARTDSDGFYYVIDRRKELIKYKGFPIAPAEVEAVLMEHPAVRDCGVVAKADEDAGEVPCAFIVLRPGYSPSRKLKQELSGYVAERLASYKQPQDVIILDAIPRTPSGKILRRDLRSLL